MLTNIEIRTQDDRVLTLDLDTYHSEYHVTKIDGLDPVKAELTSTGVASVDGAQYQSSRRGARNIVIGLDVREVFDRSIRALRQELYSFFMPKSPVTLIFYDDEYTPLSIQGRIETFEFPLFQKDPQASVSILCFDPDYYDIEPTIMEGDVYSSPNDLVVSPLTLSYTGNIDSGMTVSFWNTLGGPVINGGLQISLTRADMITQIMEFELDIPSGGIIDIDTRVGKKSVILRNRNMSEPPQSILHTMTQASDWLTLTNGPNILTFAATWVVAPLGVPLYKIGWTNKYGGL